MTLSGAFETHHAPHENMALHRHAEPYAALVLDGAFYECGPDGRYECGVGTLIVHPAWHPHGDEFSNNGAVVLNLPLEEVDSYFCGRVSDAGALEKLAWRSLECASRAALEEARSFVPLAPAPWLQRLSRLLLSDEQASIGDLAARCGVSPEHASRACRRWFGLSPAELRREARLRKAMKMLRGGARPCDAAFDAGFSDQPHLTRLLKRVTGRTPAAFQGA